MAVCLAVLLVVAATFMAQPPAAAARCQQKAHSPLTSPAAAAIAGAAAGGGGDAAALPSPAALEFLRQRCNPGPTIMEEKYVGYCYDSLLPVAGTFNGSRLRVVGAAVEVLVGNFRSLLAELRRLETSTSGVGGARYKLGECIDLAEVMSSGKSKTEAMSGVAEKLARIRSLAAAGDDRAVNNLLDMDLLWLGEDVSLPYDRCVTEVEKIPNVETLLPSMALMEPAMEMCSGLFIGFPQPLEESVY